ncbi:MAG: type III PLP-dependent enzyme, partial [Candidatus Lokiarchaeota archaeon]
MVNKSTLLELVSNNETPLIVIDHEVIRENFKKFCEELPYIKPYYAIKANPEPEIVNTLYKMGSGFDVASWEEFMIVYNVIKGNNEEKRHFMNENVIYANPVKRISSLKNLNNYLIQMTLDNYTEVEKIAKYCKNSKLLLRIDVPNTGSVVELSTKFGAPFEICIDLIKYANKKGFNIDGLSFHVGSQCSNFNNYIEAFKRANKIFEQSKQIGNKLKILDVGGGFPVPYDPQVPEFKELTKIFNTYIKLYFNDPEISVIAEPGRFLVATSATTIVEINGKATRNNKIYYYVNDGIYNTFSGVLFDHIQYHFKAFKEGKILDCAVVGPTCDALDKISLDEKLPDLEIEDLLYSENTGAY